jgi:hypothetical protein
MARYTDIDNLIKIIQDQIIDTNPNDLGYKVLTQFIAALNHAPIADVAARAEVANKICCEIEEEIVAALQSNYRAKQERVEKQLPDDFVSYMCEGKIAALRGIYDFIDELKKKYTEGQK